MCSGTFPQQKQAPDITVVHCLFLYKYQQVYFINHDAKAQIWCKNYYILKCDVKPAILLRATLLPDNVEACDNDVARKGRT